MIRACTPSDAPDLCDIYNRFVRETVVTFEEEPLAAAMMAERITAVSRDFPWLVWEEAQTIAAYAYASPWKARSAYRFSVESTIYVAPAWHRRGIGLQLYAALIAELRERDCHAVMGAIALPNPASIALHERLGFAQVAQFRQVGWKFARWIDVGYWQLLL